MTAAELLGRLRGKGITLESDGENLLLGGPPESLTAAARKTIRQARAPLLALLAIEAEADALIRQVFETIGQQVPGGAIGWAEAHQPGLLVRADWAAKAWEGAYEQHDLDGLRRGLAAYTGALCAVARAFEHEEGQR